MNLNRFTNDLGLLAGFLIGLTVQAQNIYNSGSTGADGAFNPVIAAGVLTGVPPGTVWTNGSIDNLQYTFITVPMNPSGIYNFTTINIPQNTRVRFIRNANNTPVVWLATGDVTIAGEISVAADDTDTTWGGKEYNRINPGPGGYAGTDTYWPPDGPGALPRESGNYWVPPNYDGGFVLGMRGGSGGSGSAGIAGGGGVIFLASSTEIRFLVPGTSAFGGIKTQGGNVSSREQSQSSLGGSGKALLFANRILHPRGSVWCFATRVEGPSGASFLPSPSGIGLGSGRMPSARITKVGGNTIPRDVHSKDIFTVDAGTNLVTLETLDTPPGIVFRATIYRLTANGLRDGDPTETDFPPTTGTLELATASLGINFTNGITFIKALAAQPVDIAMAPRFEGDPINQLMMAVDSSGGSTLQYQTAGGAVMSHDAAMRLAFNQGRWEFIRQYSSLGARTDRSAASGG